MEEKPSRQIVLTTSHFVAMAVAMVLGATLTFFAMLASVVSTLQPDCQPNDITIWRWDGAMEKVCVPARFSPYAKPPKKAS